MNLHFKNKVTIVTGAASGIGKAAAIAFAKGGAKLVLADLHEAGDTLKEIRSSGGEAITVVCDVSDETQVKAMVDSAINTYGQLDIAFNNAGIEGTSAPVHELTAEQWEKTIAVNLKSVFLCMKHEIPEMLRHGSGAIVNCSSVAGLVGFAGASAYCASKFGIIGITKATALENARTGIRVNAVCPGIIHTPMIERATGHNKEAEKGYANAEPVGRLGTPEEVANAVLWLCSDAASFVTGHAMTVDGGWVAQ